MKAFVTQVPNRAAQSREQYQSKEIIGHSVPGTVHVYEYKVNKKKTVSWQKGDCSNTNPAITVNLPANRFKK